VRFGPGGGREGRMEAQGSAIDFENQNISQGCRMQKEAYASRPRWRPGRTQYPVVLPGEETLKPSKTISLPVSIASVSGRRLNLIRASMATFQPKPSDFGRGKMAARFSGTAPQTTPEEEPLRQPPHHQRVPVLQRPVRCTCLFEIPFAS
jgi:hypothetical protein